MTLLQTDILSIHFKRLCTYFRSWLFYYLWHTRILLQPLKNRLCVSIKTIRLLWIEPFMINMIGLTNAIVINPFGQVECSRIFDITLTQLEVVVQTNKFASNRVMSFIYAWRRSVEAAMEHIANKSLQNWLNNSVDLYGWGVTCFAMKQIGSNWISKF